MTHYESQGVVVVLIACTIFSFFLGSFVIDFKKYDYDTRKGTILCEGAESIIVWNTKIYCLKEGEE